MKRTLDLTVSTLLLLFLSPVFLVLAFMVSRSGRPIFYGDKRVGLGGRVFTCFKFRTMVPDANARLAALLASDPALKAEWDATCKLKNDPRITPIGRFLRRTSLDELPQLWNVLIGDMSLVGPRPMLLIEPQRWGGAFESYTAVRPGVTGLWQIGQRSDSDYGERIRLHAQYIHGWTIWQDIVILARTLKVPFRKSGAY